ncbi:MAG: lipid A phosphate methyltransferase [Rhodospirillales bacterium]|nr:lipid A phosphate methyltransferase [Rhodospirillales bacterium]
MRIRDRLEREGSFLFRWRSYVPLTLLPLIMMALPEEDRVAAQIGPNLEHAIFYFAILVSFAGLAMRWATIAFVPPGTSGRNTLSQRADQLNTTGMYSLVRNPLYLGNFIAMLGVLICIKVWWVIAIFALCYWLYIERVIAVEEAYLEQKFGASYRAWTERVPAFIPKFGNWTPPSGAFSLPFLLRREYNGLLAVGGSFFALELILDVFVRREPFAEWLVEDAGWFALGATTLLIFLLLRFLKTQTRVLNT